MKRLPALLLVILLAACAAAPPDNLADVQSQAPDTLFHSPEFGAALHDYLVVQHPEMLAEMTAALRQKQQAAAAAQAKAALAANPDAVFRDPADPVVGNPAGDVSVVEFFDYGCPYCKLAAPNLERLYATDKGVRVVYKEFPILGPVSLFAAKAALAAGRQGKYEAFHNALMADQTIEGKLTEAHVLEIAKTVRLDVERLKQDMNAPEIAAQIAATKALGTKLGVQTTPSLIFADKLMSGAMSYEAMTRTVAAARGRPSTGGNGVRGGIADPAPDRVGGRLPGGGVTNRQAE